MDPLDPEFPYPTRKELETVTEYFKAEEEFMADQNYFKSYRRIRTRQYGILMISKYSQGEGLNAFIPYLAMNYFDRIVSRHPVPNIEASDKENIRLFAICCLTIAWKMWTRSFSVSQFLRDKFLEIPMWKILEMEFCILNTLNWRMRPITAFSFLNYYYPKYRAQGGFKRRCIHEIIVQSLEEMSMTHYKPSVVAKSSFLAATNILYGRKPHTPNVDLQFCYNELVEMCRNKNIKIEPASWAIISRSIARAALKRRPAEVRHRPSGPVSIPGTSSPRGKTYQTKTVPKTERPAEILPAEEASPQKLWNFDLQWIKRNAEGEDKLVIPSPDADTLETQESRGTSTNSIIMSRLRANILNNRIGCSCCNIL